MPYDNKRSYKAEEGQSRPIHVVIPFGPVNLSVLRAPAGFAAVICGTQVDFFLIKVECFGHLEENSPCHHIGLEGVSSLVYSSGILPNSKMSTLKSYTSNMFLGSVLWKVFLLAQMVKDLPAECRTLDESIWHTLDWQRPLGLELEGAGLWGADQGPHLPSQDLRSRVLRGSYAGIMWTSRCIVHMPLAEICASVSNSAACLKCTVFLTWWLWDIASLWLTKPCLVSRCPNDLLITFIRIIKMKWYSI